MILEELVGVFVSLTSGLCNGAPQISRESPQREFTSVFEENPERHEIFDGLIHREYQQEPEPELPYYEEDILIQTDEQPRRSSCESFFRSFKANIGLLMAVVFISSFLAIGAVFVDLNTTDACIEWMHKNLTVPSHERTLQMVGTCVKMLPLIIWFPACVVMLWGFKESKKNYLLCLCVCQLVTGSINCVYRIVMFKKFETVSVSFNLYRLPSSLMSMLSIVCCAYLVARKFTKVDPTSPYSVFRIFAILSLAFLGSILLADTYTFVVIKYFKETGGGTKKAVIAALTPVIIFPFTAITKYIVLRKSSKIITPDRGFVLCYFLSGGSIVLYRTMQAGFQNIWLFIGLSLLHGASNVLSKSTLNFRIKMWTFFIKCLSNTCCAPRLEVLPLESPRVRRFDADLEIQNVLFQYTTAIVSQAYLACYFVMSFDVSPWPVIRASLIRIAISLGIDFVFNIISVFIQIHIYDIPMRKVWLKHWRRHVAANVFIVVCIVLYFGTSLVSVFADNKLMFSAEYKLRNCTTVF